MPKLTIDNEISYHVYVTSRNLCPRFAHGDVGPNEKIPFYMCNGLRVKIEDIVS